MKKILMSVYVLLLTTSSGIGQKNRPVYSAGPAILIPTYSQIKSPGLGFGLKVDFKPHKKLSFVSDIGINAFNGDIVNQFTNKIVKGLIIMPVLAGVKWSASKNLYFAGLAGVAFGLENAGTNFSLSPGMGYLLKFGGKRMADLGLRLTGVLPKTSIPENTFLEKGGYSFLSLRLAYQF